MPSNTRKKPFSGKKKKEQLQEKRQRKQTQAGALMQGRKVSPKLEAMPLKEGHLFLNPILTLDAEEHARETLVLTEEDINRFNSEMRGPAPSFAVQQPAVSANPGRAMGRGRFQLSNAEKYANSPFKARMACLFMPLMKLLGQSKHRVRFVSHFSLSSTI